VDDLATREPSGLRPRRRRPPAPAPVVSSALGHFPPTRDAALARLAAVDPDGYARHRNALAGPVTRLGPYLTHGLISVPEVVGALAARGVGPGHKLVFELAWREYWQHVWRHLGVGILRDIRRPPPRVEYAAALPSDVLQGATGVPVIDAAVRSLYESGYVHNHARMWLASYLIHLRKVHWRAGADWLYGHLLDGDLGANHLSWQWVAGTFAARPYLFTADNVARFAPDLVRPGTALDRSYADLARFARSNERVGPERDRPRALSPPPLVSVPPGVGAAALPPLAGRDVVLVHPWALGERVPGSLAIGVLHLPFHRAFPWSAARWRFVLERLCAVTDLVWAGDLLELVGLLAAARSVVARATLNPGYREALGAASLRLEPVPRQFPDPAPLCESFACFWRLAGPSRRPAAVPAAA